MTPRFKMIYNDPFMIVTPAVEIANSRFGRAILSKELVFAVNMNTGALTVVDLGKEHAVSTIHHLYVNGTFHSVVDGGIYDLVRDLQALGLTDIHIHNTDTKKHTIVNTPVSIARALL